jgi:hypothetical protein
MLTNSAMRLLKMNHENSFFHYIFLETLKTYSKIGIDLHIERFLTSKKNMTEVTVYIFLEDF